ncbi:MAG: PEP-CTERM sorting domain-containing protein [Verrucomicrobia bacterium]|nr:PEP-CTERM sorting domain-containing protein [Verrucomicrobiota bacterium]
MKLLTLKLMVAMAFIASSSSALAQWTLLDDFEGSALGDVNGQNGWTATNNSSTGHPIAVYNVDIDPTDASNQVLYVAPSTTSGNNAYIPLGSGIADGTTGTAFFRMSLSRNDAPVGNGTLGGDFVFGSSDLAAPFTWSSYEGYMVMANGNIRIRNGGGFDDVSTYNADEWYNYWLVLDNATDTTSLYSSQGLDPAVLLGTGAFRNGTTDPLVTLNLRIGELLNNTSGRLDSIYFDPSGANLSNPIPEPGTIALAIGACLLAVGTRRRSS